MDESVLKCIVLRQIMKYFLFDLNTWEPGGEWRGIYQAYFMSKCCLGV